MHTVGMEDSQCVGSWSFSALSHPSFELGTSVEGSFHMPYVESVENNLAAPSHMSCVYILMLPQKLE